MAIIPLYKLVKETLFIMKKMTSVMPKTLSSDPKTSEILSLLVKSDLKFLLLAEYRSGTVNSKSFVGKVFLRIKRKFELTYCRAIRQSMVLV